MISRCMFYYFSCVSGLTADELEPGEEVDQLPKSEGIIHDNSIQTYSYNAGFILMAAGWREQRVSTFSPLGLQEIYLSLVMRFGFKLWKDCYYP